MMRCLGLPLILILVCCSAAGAPKNPFLGKWDIMGKTARGIYIYWLEVKEEDGRLTGYFLNRTGSVLKLPEIAIEGITGGALDSNEDAPGPIMIQGDHSRIWIRTVAIIPIP